MTAPTLTEFLLARIAEDEAEAWRWNADAGGGDWDSLEARVLAECEAKRRIVEGCVESQYRWILSELASAYADHPAYRQEWKP